MKFIWFLRSKRKIIPIWNSCFLFYSYVQKTSFLHCQGGLCFVLCWIIKDISHEKFNSINSNRKNTKYVIKVERLWFQFAFQIYKTKILFIWLFIKYWKIEKRFLENFFLLIFYTCTNLNSGKNSKSRPPKWYQQASQPMLRPSVTTLAQYAVIIAPYRVNNLFYFPCFLVKRLLSEIFKVLAKGSIISFFLN